MASEDGFWEPLEKPLLGLILVAMVGVLVLANWQTWELVGVAFAPESAEVQEGLPDGVADAPTVATATGEDDGEASRRHRILGLSVDADPDIALLLVALVGGATGAFVHAASSFSKRVGGKSFHPSWFWWYILRPGVGMALALIVYFAIRGGLLTVSGSAEDLSPFGVGAIAGITGLASNAVAEKLRQVLDVLFGFKHGNSPEA